jgi:hypothetical protein
MSDEKKSKDAMESAIQEIFGPDPMQQSLAANGITSDELAKQLKAQLKAKETKFFQHEGSVVEKRNVIAWGVRQKATDMVLKLMGAYPPEKKELSGPKGEPLALIMNFGDPDTE